MANFVYVPIKIGDKPDKTLLHGSPLGYIDPDDYPDFRNYTFSNHTKKVFGLLKINKQYLPFIKSLQFLSSNKKLNKLQSSGSCLLKKTFSFDSFFNKINDFSLFDKWRSNKPVEPIDIDNPIPFFEDSSLFKPFVPDLNIVTSGSYSIGVAKDYATFALFVSDVGNLTGSILGQFQTNVTETAFTFYNNALNGFSFIVNSDINHYGNQSNGRLITLNYPAFTEFFSMSHTGNGNVYCHNLNIKSIGLDNAFFLSQVSATATLHLYDLLLDGNNNISSGITVASGSNCNFYNIILNYCNGDSFFQDSASIAGGSRFLENIAVIFSSGGAEAGYSGFDLDGIACNLKNCFSFGFGAFDVSFNNKAAATLSKCASNDSTGSEASLINLAPGNEIESFLIADGDNFLLPKLRQNLYGTGTNVGISGHNDYINNLSITTDDVDIGAKGTIRPSFTNLFHQLKYW